MLQAIITLPSATSTLTSISEWASPIFNAFWPIALVGIAIYVGFWAVHFILDHFKRKD